MDYIFEKDGICYHTGTGKVVNPRKYLPERENVWSPLANGDMERDTSKVVFPERVRKNQFYSYDTEVLPDGVVLLSIYEGHFEEKMEWEPVYSAFAVWGKTGIDEIGNTPIEHWIKELGDRLPGSWNEGTKQPSLLFLERTPGSMARVREVFPCDLSPNALYFFLKMKHVKKLSYRRYDPALFAGVPAPRLNRKVGRDYDSEKHDGHRIHYAWQSEVVLQGQPFLHVQVISGMVTNGVMDVEEKHRFFLAEDFVYSPDGGDFGVFASPYFFGNVHLNKFRKAPNGLLLERYRGKHVYLYMFSRYYLPAFEIPAKAGYTELADLILDAWRGTFREFGYGRGLRYFGENDREIFGFRLKALAHISPDVIGRLNARYGLNALIRVVAGLQRAAPGVLKIPMDWDLFEFLNWDIRMPNLQRRVEYLRRIGTENSELYRDYLRMCLEEGKYADGQGQYPSDLRLAHDAMVAYRAELRVARNAEEFLAAVQKDRYQEKIYIPEGEEYCVLAPRASRDLVEESYSLNHCVRTYIWDVARGYTMIYFLRKQAQKGKSLVTLEVRNDALVQARGKANRSITPDEKAFLQKWTREKGLKYNVIYRW